MPANKPLKNTIHTITNLIQQVIGYIAGAVSRIFSPTEDDYPKTGVQPFEGDPADE